MKKQKHCNQRTKKCQVPPKPVCEAQAPLESITRGFCDNENWPHRLIRPAFRKTIHFGDAAAAFMNVIVRGPRKQRNTKKRLIHKTAKNTQKVLLAKKNQS